MSEIHQHKLKNGLWLVAEPVSGAQSLAMTLMTPGGIIHEPASQQGMGAVLSEMVWRGAGELDARGHSDALDFLGVQRGSNVESTGFRLSATMVGSKLSEALPLITDMIRKPTLDESGLEPSVDLAVQAIESLEDEPQQKTFLEMRAKAYPSPFDRSPMGKIEHMRNLSAADVQAFSRRAFVPNGSIISFAGNFDFDALRDQVEALLGDWEGDEAAWQLGEIPSPQAHHVHADSTQMHIGMGYHTITETHEQSFLQKAACAVLSGGMSGRLFTEVREKRGLCYAVYASYASSKHLGIVLAYAGTTVARAQETHDVMKQELIRLSDGITESEFARAIVGMKSRLVMQGESTSARAGAIAFDQYTFGKPRTLDELTAKVDAITLDDLNAYVKANRPDAMSVVTIGPEPLKTD